MCELGKVKMVGSRTIPPYILTGSTRLRPNDSVKISSLPDKGPFEVTENGGSVGESHLDVFIGDETMQSALNLGTLWSKVSVWMSS